MGYSVPAESFLEVSPGGLAVNVKNIEAHEIRDHQWHDGRIRSSARK